MKTYKKMLSTGAVAVLVIGLAAAPAAAKNDKNTSSTTTSSSGDGKTGVTGNGSSNPNANAGGNGKSNGASSSNAGGSGGSSGSGSTVLQVSGNAPALATSCGSVVSGCLFTENDTAKFVGVIQSTYNGQVATGAPTIESLAFVTKLDGGATAALTGSAGTWTSATPVNFVSVKAGNGFLFYALEAPATTGTWSTAALGGKDLSHLSLWSGVVKYAQGASGPSGPGGGTDTGPAPGDDGMVGVGGVPEPATWAMMIGGLGLVGWTLRRRSAVASA